MLENFSISSLRVFKNVYEHRSMSAASKALFMTQPGVSQHIKAIEDQLGLKLFDRIGKKLIPTNDATGLYPEITKGLKVIERALMDCSSKERNFKGVIKVGLPIEIGNNLILPRIAQWAKKYPKVYFEFNYDHILRQAPLIVSGELDFAITDSYSYPKEIHTENLLQENLVLCMSKDYAKTNNLTAKSGFKEIIEADFIRYLPGAPILTQWFEFHYKKKSELNYKVTLMDVQGVLNSIKLGMGIGVVPRHVLKQHGEKDIIIIRPTNKVLKNKISLVYLKDRSHSPQAQSLIKDLLETFKDRK